MRVTQSLMLFLALVFSTSATQAAIFGTDDRIAITPQDSAYSYARSTAVAVLSSNFDLINNKITLSTDHSTDFLCKEERFSQDPSLSYACTGFLVAPDLIATAGHCMVNAGESRNETASYCEAFSWLFDYTNTGNGKPPQLKDIPQEKLYHCKQIIYAIKEETAPFRDYALVQLDRPVEGRKPFKLSTRKDAPLSMIGYPLGMPAKLAHDSKILLDNPSRQSFITNLDAFEGNSGSPVFNQSMEVIGILIAGTPTLSLIHKDNNNSCQMYNRCDENGLNCILSDKPETIIPGFQKTGSEVQRIEAIQELIRAHQALEK